MAYVAENKTFKTVFGKMYNKNKAKQIILNGDVIFDFSISEVTVSEGNLTVVCNSITGSEISYTVDLDGAKAELPKELYNYTLNGTVQHFLALVWSLWESTVNSDGEQVDAMSYEQLSDMVASLTGEKETLTGQVATLTEEKETLTGQVATLTEEKETLTEEKETLTEQVAGLNKDYEDLTALMNELDDYVEFLQSQFTEEQLAELQATYDAQQETGNNSDGNEGNEGGGE